MYIPCIYQGTSAEQNIFDVRETVRSKEDIVPFIVAVHPLSGCDAAAHIMGWVKLQL